MPIRSKPAGVGSRSKLRSGNSASKARARKVIATLKREYPNAKAALNFNSAFELLIATILSAQCTDARVNMVTPALFRKYPSPKTLAGADIKEIEREIRSTGFFRQKAKSIIGCSESIVEEFGGEVPRTLEELTSLKGVGRKTANVVLGNAFGIPGIAVDTHVKRLSNRLGFSDENDPVKIELDLMNLFPAKHWAKMCHLLMAHGRNTCLARQAKCKQCVLNKLCPSAFTLKPLKG